MKQALEAYCKTLNPLWNTGISRTEAEGFFEAGFKASVAEAEKQEPVACPYCKNWATLGAVYYDQNCAGCVKRMTHPQPKREWVGLTDEEMLDCLTPLDAEAKRLPLGFKWFAQAIEAKLKEKNT